MSMTIRSLNAPHIIGAVVTCGAVLGIASMIHPTDSAAVPSIMSEFQVPEHVAPEFREAGVSLGTLRGRGFSATIEAGYPGALIFLDDTATAWVYEGLTVHEYLLAEPELASDEFDEGLDAWPEALMDVDVDAAPW